MSAMLRFLSLCLCLAVTTGVAAELPSPCSKAPIQFFDSNGIKIAYIDVGQGEPVVLLHGFTMNLDIVRGWGDEFVRAGYRAIALDLRGHGRSDKPPEARAYGKEMAEDVLRLLDHLNVRQAHVFGYSLGGVVANKLRELHPDRLITAILGGVGRDVTNFKRGVDITKVAQDLRTCKGVEILVRAAFGDTLTEKEIEDMNKIIMKGQDPRALAAILDAQADLNVSNDSLKNNSIPTLVLIGELDDQKSSAEKMAKQMPKATLVIVQGADHMQAPDSPKFLGSVLRFLQKNRKN